MGNVSREDQFKRPIQVGALDASPSITPEHLDYWSSRSKEVEKDEIDTGMWKLKVETGGFL